MRTFFGAMAVLVLIGGASLADSIDDAEANRRGVTIEHIQLEKAQKALTDANAANARMAAQLLQEEKDASAKIAEADKRAEDAEAKSKEFSARADKAEADLAMMKANLTPALSEKVKAQVARRKEIADAIESHKLLNGMTLEEVGIAMGEKPRKVGQVAGDDRFEATYKHFVKNPLSSGMTQVADRYIFTARDEIVVAWTSLN